MPKVLICLATIAFGLLVTFITQNEANALPVASQPVFNLQQFLKPNSNVQTVNGYHCRERFGPFIGWHNHPAACDGHFDQDDDPYYEDEDVVAPRRRLRERRARARGCTRARQRACNRRWRHSSKRRARCLRKYRC